MIHLKYAPIGSPWSVPPGGLSQVLAIYPKMGQKKQKKGQKRLNVAKKVILLVKIRPLENVFYAFSPVHLFCPSERFVLDPKTLIRESVFMEIWPKQNRTFSEFLSKNSFFSPIKIWSKRSLKIVPKLRVLWSKCWNPILKCRDWWPICTYQFWSRCLGSACNVAAYLGIFKKLKWRTLKWKISVTKVWKWKNLRWQFSSIFHPLRHPFFL